jgi:hypothetical protein
MGNHSSSIHVLSAAALAVLLAGCFGGEPAKEESAPAPSTPTTMPSAPPTTLPPTPESGAPASTESTGAEGTGDESVRLKPGAPLHYVVKKGDTLWDISSYYLKDPWQWPELWYANPKVKNPHLIYPGDELVLMYVNGQPRVERAGEPGPEQPAEPNVPATEAVFGPHAREAPLAEAIPTIPIDAIRAFLNGPRLVDKKTLRNAPYVVDFDEPHVISGDSTLAYVLELKDRSKTAYQVVRQGEEYRDPDDGDVIGYEAIPVAETEVRVFGDPATVYLTRSHQETRKGDHLLPIEPDAGITGFVPHAPKKDVGGRIISVYNGLTQIGQYQIVAINRGSDNGLEPGHMLAIIQSGRNAKDPYSWFGSTVQLPDIYAGQVMVFKTTPRLSYALVMTALRAIHRYDRVEKPIPTE